MHIQSELRVVLLPSTCPFQQVPGLFIPACCSSSVNLSTAFCFSMASSVTEGATFKKARRIYHCCQVDLKKKKKKIIMIIKKIPNPNSPSWVCDSFSTLNECWIWTASELFLPFTQHSNNAGLREKSQLLSPKAHRHIVSNAIYTARHGLQNGLHFY